MKKPISIRKTRHRIPAFAFCALLMAVPVLAYAQGTGIQVKPIPGLKDSFIRGADISTFKQIEELGGSYFDAAGTKTDLLKILKDSGVTWIRLRLWNNPVNPTDVVVDGKVLSKAGEPAGGGNNDLARTINVAQRAKAAGLKVLLDLHYSDFWADPGKQNKPSAWKNLGLAELKTEIYGYTAKVLKDMNTAKALPDMVQIGNELNGGLLWPEGKTWQQNPDEKIGGYDGFAELLKQASKAVRDFDPQAKTAARIKVMVHLADGGDNDLYHRVFDELTRRGLDFDAIGLSYYPYWHGALSGLQANMNDISARYKKDVAVVETAYAYTFDNGDSFGNIFGPGMDKNGGYKATIQGQATAIRDVMNAVASVPGGRGLGVFYWEPAWLPLAGAGWRTGEGNGWENQALFDFKGKALPSLAVFKLVSGKSAFEAVPAEALPVELTIGIGDQPALPAKIKAVFSDDSIREIGVTWAAIAPASLKQTGSFTVKGSIAGSTTGVLATVQVVSEKNLLKNPGFENGNYQGWDVAGDTNAVATDKNPANAHASDWSFKYWLDRDFKFRLSQKISGLADGNYTLRAWASGGGGEKSFTLFADGYGGAAMTSAVTNTGWQKWARYEIRGIAVRNGQCVIGLDVDAFNGNWGNIDDLEFFLEK